MLPTQTNGAGAENGVKEAEKGKKRPIEEEELASAPQAKTARRSLGSATRVEEEEEKMVQEVKKKGRRSLAVAPTPASPAGRLAANFNCFLLLKAELIKSLLQNQQEEVLVRVNGRLQLPCAFPCHQGAACPC